MVIGNVETKTQYYLYMTWLNVSASDQKQVSQEPMYRDYRLVRVTQRNVQS